MYPILTSSASFLFHVPHSDLMYHILVPHLPYSYLILTSVLPNLTHSYLIYPVRISASFFILILTSSTSSLPHSYFCLILTSFTPFVYHVTYFIDLIHTLSISSLPRLPHSYLIYLILTSCLILTSSVLPHLPHSYFIFLTRTSSTSFLQYLPHLHHSYLPHFYPIYLLVTSYLIHTSSALLSRFTMI